eukprot:TRINITY_DN97594_c0_g1_i1.p1 TRINITY_DN97594_c0_g1~~TRINITY_DN97594_c0_g1_i1.p1  ORF type:complete len:105 (-),score=31.53 TRINITY_DN97594_c0_g1_i1:120-434(-)
MKRSYIGQKKNTTSRHLGADELENNIGGLPVTDNKLRELFHSLDTNGNGFLDFQEMKEVYKSFDNYGLEYTDREIENHIMKYHSGDGKVTFDEFACIVLSLAQR